jgi:hypothetical protein
VGGLGSLHFCQGSEGPWYMTVLTDGSQVAAYIYTSFSLRDFPQCSPVSLYREGHRANRCTLLDVARIVQEVSYRDRNSTANGQEAILRKKKGGRTLSLIIDEVKTGEIHGLSR